jgi:lycopene cyclase-like protein
MTSKIIIIGSGPSGLFLGTYLCIKYPDLNIKICDKNLNQNWHCTYCAFEDEFINSWFDQLFKSNEYIFHKWKGFEFKNNDQTIKINKTYIELNNSIIKTILLQILKSNPNIDLIEQNILNIDNNKVILNNNIALYADFIIDCSGQKSKFFKYINNDKNLYEYEQKFYGQRIKSTQINIPNPDYITLMDFTTSNYDSLIDYKTFTYILPYTQNDAFFEETILSIPKSNNISYQSLNSKLNLKLNSKFNINFDTQIKSNYDIKFIEQNKFDFEGNIAIPLISNKYLYSYGATSGLLNPISGYMIGFLIYDIPFFVDNLFYQTKKDFNSTKIKKLIYTYGGDVLLELQKKENTKEFDNFYNCFFNQPIDKWYPFLTRRSNISNIIFNMIKLFVKFNFNTKIILISVFFKNIYKYFKQFIFSFLI